MQLVRLVFVSENAIDVSERSMIAQVNEILQVGNRNNEKVGVTGALIFDRNWFVQALEGGIRSVWGTYERIMKDTRHRNIRFLEMKAADRRMFDNWWIGCFEMTRDTAMVSAPYLHEGKFLPDLMGADKILALMADHATVGYNRRLKN